MPFAAPRAERAAGAPLPFRMGLPALDAFPRKLWSSADRRAPRAASAPTRWPIRIRPACAPLREAIAAYLGVSRGIACTPDQVLVTAGYQGALALVARVLLRPGDAGVGRGPRLPPGPPGAGGGGRDARPGAGGPRRHARRRRRRPRHRAPGWRW